MQTVIIVSVIAVSCIVGFLIWLLYRKLPENKIIETIPPVNEIIQDNKPRVYFVDKPTKRGYNKGCFGGAHEKKHYGIVLAKE